MSRVTATAADREDAEVFARARHGARRVPDLPSTARVHVRDGVVALTAACSGRPRAPPRIPRCAPWLACRRVLNRIVAAPLIAPGLEPPETGD